MKFKSYWVVLCIVLLAASVRSASAQQFVTLHAPRQENKHDQSKAWFNFQYGVMGKVDKRITGNTWDLGYGFLSIGNEDWFQLSHAQDDRSVIKDLGEHNWPDSFDIPALVPLPTLEKGQTRNFTVDASASTHETWKQSNGIFAKAVVGHIYLVRIKRNETDYYALFRLEEIEQRVKCTVSWKLIPPPVE